MLFTSQLFLEFFALIVVGLILAPNRTVRQAILLAGSICFYGSWRPAYLLILAVPGFIDYYCASAIAKSNSPSRRRALVTASVISNLGLLGYFKYTNFFLATVAGVFGAHFRAVEITLPLGISFFTFKALSYTIDVYRGSIMPCTSFWRFAMFLTYFPELIAGPIVRAAVFLPQMDRSLRFSTQRLFLGSQMFLLGMTKKLLIADRLAPFVDAVFTSPQLFSPLTVTASVVAYSLQIYCDFSGYSDMAIGVSKIIGFDLPENFNMPYLASSLPNFWLRWHITLSTWLRDYLYISLGGNRRGRGRTYLNLLTTMLLGGLWHGASWIFVTWGLLHGLGLVVVRAVDGRIKLPRLVAWGLTYLFVCFTWVFFRAPSWAIAMLVLKKMLWLDRTGMIYIYSPLLPIFVCIMIGHIIGVLAARSTAWSGWKVARAPKFLRFLYRGPNAPFAVRSHPSSGIYVMLPPLRMPRWAFLTVWLVTLFLFAPVNSSPFIYFQF